jgi:hypothetical protein
MTRRGWLHFRLGAVALLLLAAPATVTTLSEDLAHISSSEVMAKEIDVTGDSGMAVAAEQTAPATLLAGLREPLRSP